MVVNLTNISEQLRLEAQLQQAQKMESIGRLAGGVAHDFNNMLGVILGHTELAIDRLAPTHPVHADLREIYQAAERSAELTKQLLAFARQQAAAPRVLDLNETIAGMLKMLRRLIGEDIDLAWMPGAPLWPVKIDPTQLDQILANLCTNARDAIDGVGRLTIETRSVQADAALCAPHPGFVPGPYVRLSISDTGGGMDARTRENLFEPFFTTKSVGEGTGLGLATVYGIVKQNKGVIYVDSVTGKGTTFHIYLPREAAPVEKPLRTTAPDVVGGRETVLVVEDEAGILKMSRQILERFGYTVLAAGRPSEALDLVARHPDPIDLLITDVVMPEMNGKALKERIERQLPGIKALFMSGYTTDAVVNRGIVEADVHFIQKPFSVNDLAVKVRAVLEAPASSP
jgi:nitrogen-specific signal transduction histidine kinase/ActR/RegA family two-component response regulator